MLLQSQVPQAALRPAAQLLASKTEVGVSKGAAVTNLLVGR